MLTRYFTSVTGITRVPAPNLYTAFSVPVTLFPERLPENVPVDNPSDRPVLAIFVPLMMTGVVLAYEPFPGLHLLISLSTSPGVWYDSASPTEPTIAMPESFRRRELPTPRASDTRASDC